MKFLLVVCVALALAAAEPLAENYKETRLSKKEGRNLKPAPQSQKVFSFDLVSYDELLAKLRLAFEYMNICHYDPYDLMEHLNHSKRMKGSKQGSKQKKHKRTMSAKQANPEGQLLLEVQHTIESLAGNFNGWLDHVLSESTPDALKETVISVALDIFVHWTNETSNSIDLAKRRAPRKVLPGEPPLSAICDFVFVLGHYLNHCSGREQECLVQLAQILTDEQTKPDKKQRYGPDHYYFVEAVKELAQRLEAAANPDEHDLYILAQSISHLFEDVEILINKPKVETNLLVLLDTYNVLQFVDSCAQNQLCSDEFIILLDK